MAGLKDYDNDTQNNMYYLYFENRLEDRICSFDLLSIAQNVLLVVWSQVVIYMGKC